MSVIFTLSLDLGRQRVRRLAWQFSRKPVRPEAPVDQAGRVEHIGRAEILAVLVRHVGHVRRRFAHFAVSVVELQMGRARQTRSSGNDGKARISFTGQGRSNTFCLGTPLSGPRHGEDGAGEDAVHRVRDGRHGVRRDDERVAGVRRQRQDGALHGAGHLPEAREDAAGADGRSLRPAARGPRSLFCAFLGPLCPNSTSNRRCFATSWGWTSCCRTSGSRTPSAVSSASPRTGASFASTLSTPSRASTKSRLVSCTLYGLAAMQRESPKSR